MKGGGGRCSSVIVMLACSLGAPSCLPHHVEDNPKARVKFPRPKVATEPSGPASASATTGSKQAPQLATQRAFWAEFQDPALNSLVDAALRNNFDLKGAFARIEQARAISKQVAAARWPTMGLAGAAVIGRNINPAVGAIDTISLGVSLPVGYELDLFARYRAAADASEFEAKATRMDWATLRLTLASEVVDAWYSWVLARERLALSAEQAKINKDYLGLLQSRVERGLAPQVDAYQQQVLYWQSKGQVESVRMEQELAQQQLHALVVQWPDGGWEKLAERAPKHLPWPSKLSSISISGERLAVRPDVRAARLRVQAADFSVGSAVAQYFPALSFSVLPGYNWLRVQSDAGTREVSGFTISAGAQLSWPLFDGFARQGLVEQNEALVQERLEQLNHVTLMALVETRSALIQEQGVRAVLEARQKELEAARAALSDSLQRYKLGVTDFVPVLLALRSEQSSAVELLSIHRQLVAHRSQLHRALAGEI